MTIAKATRNALLASQWTRKARFGTDVGGSDLVLLIEGFQSWEVSRRLGCRTRLDIPIHKLSHDLVTICDVRFLSIDGHAEHFLDRCWWK